MKFCKIKEFSLVFLNKNKKLIIGEAIFFILLVFCTSLFLFNRKKDTESLGNNLPQLEDVNTEENTSADTSTEEKNTENKKADDELADNTTSKNEPTNSTPKNKPAAGGGGSNSNQGTSKPPTKPSKPTNAGLKIGEVPALLKSLGYEYTPRLILYHISEMREDGEHMQLVNLKFMVNTPKMLNIIQTLLNKTVPSGASKLYNIINTNEYISTQIYKYDGKTVRIYTNGECLNIDIDYLGNYVN
ncbi:hypothetical protein [Clostridium paraputrificum]|uniref:hypothetical protein n=1 Tax=Clostridium paraputrificum TaxID=29363 RepID=UPI0018A055A7|nr:hypothetical protein [Clostridium paraputrificum]